jgi:ParB-like chromosome segregation protein Spo0J
MNAKVMELSPQYETRAMIENVPIVALKPGASPRLAGENSAHVRMLAGLDIDLPPILVHRPSMRVVDGMHRLRAAILRGQDAIAVRFLDCDEKEVFAAAVEANVKHGLPLSLADREAAACRILLTNPQWSDRLVASITGLSHKTVGTLRGRASGETSQLHDRMGRDGRIRPVSTVLGRRKAADLIRQDPAKSLREVARAAGVSVGTVRDVRRRLDSGLDPVPEPHHAGGQARLQAVPERPGQAGPAAEAAFTGAEAARARNISASDQGKPATDTNAILQSLSRDPSLRFCEKGRLLIRLLHTSMVCVTKLKTLADTVPTHRTATIAQLARACAESWSSLARQLEQPPSSR